MTNIRRISTSSMTGCNKETTMKSWIIEFIGLFLVCSIQLYWWYGTTTTLRTTTTPTTTTTTLGSLNRDITISSDRPVILLGLPHSGSFAFFNYFSCRGYRSSHYCCSRRTSNEEKVATVPTKFPCISSSSDSNSPSSLSTCGECLIENFAATTTQTNDHASSIPLGLQHNCGGYEVWTQFDVEVAKGWFLPQHFSLAQLHKAYPTATWILNLRSSPTVWANSVIQWHSQSSRLLYELEDDAFHHDRNRNGNEPSHKDLSSLTITREDLVKEMQTYLDREQQQQQPSSLSNTTNLASMTQRQETIWKLENLYKKHVRKVRQWAKNFPSHSFLQIVVDDAGDAIQTVLDETFSLPKTETKCPFSFSNDNGWQAYDIPLLQN